jgi:hypothetical protein
VFGHYYLCLGVDVGRLGRHHDFAVGPLLEVCVLSLFNKKEILKRDLRCLITALGVMVCRGHHTTYILLRHMCHCYTTYILLRHMCQCYTMYTLLQHLCHCYTTCTLVHTNQS